MSSKITDNNGKQNLSTANVVPAGVLRILAAWLYDFLLLCAVWLLAGIIYIIPAQFFVQIDSAQSENLTTTAFTGPIYYGYLLLVTWYFFAWFWTHGGQTLGLRSWSIRLQTDDGHLISWPMSIVRFLVAAAPWFLALFVYDLLKTQYNTDSAYLYLCFLIGFSGLLSTILDKQGRSIQDIISRTRLVRIFKTLQ